MADVTLTPTPPAPGIPAVQGSGGSGSATATQTLLSALSSGALIRGFVLNRDPNGNPILRTPQGDLTIQSDLFLKIGSDVVARVNTPGSQVRASIISVDGHSPQEAANPAAQEPAVLTQPNAPAPQNTAPRTTPQPQNAPAQAEQVATPAPAIVRQAATLTGTLIRPAPPAENPLPNAPQPLPAGTQITFRLVAATPPQPPAQAPAQPQIPAQAAATPQAPQSAPVIAETETPPATQPPQQQPPATPLAQQYGVYTRSVAVQTPQPTQPPPPAQALTQAPTQTPTQPNIVQAQITSHAPATGTVIAQTPLGSVQIENAPPLPAGTQLSLEVVHTAPPPAALTPAAKADALPATIAGLADNWNALTQIVDVLTQLDPETATHFLRMALPASAYGEEPAMQNLHPTAQNLSTGMTYFMNAVTNGTLRGWLGDKAVNLLQEHGHADLITRAEDDFSAMRAVFSDAPPQQWQALFVPVMAEGQVRQLRLFLKRDRKQERGKRPQSDTRFVVEMELSATGQLQLDGLVRKREGATQFDLVIRSRSAFTPAEQRDMTGIYNAIGSATGYSGGVTFQQTQEFSVRPLEEILAERHREVLA